MIIFPNAFNDTRCTPAIKNQGSAWGRITRYRRSSIYTPALIRWMLFYPCSRDHRLLRPGPPGVYATLHNEYHRTIVYRAPHVFVCITKRRHLCACVVEVLNFFFIVKRREDLSHKGLVRHSLNTTIRQTSRHNLQFDMCMYVCVCMCNPSGSRGVWT